MSDSIVVSGFVILPPLFPWDEKHRDEIFSHVAPGTFGRSAGEAWTRHVGNASPPEKTRLVQYWHDRGYRLAQSVMTINVPKEAKDE